jgi:hypothetical protein
MLLHPHGLSPTFVRDQSLVAGLAGWRPTWQHPSYNVAIGDRTMDKKAKTPKKPKQPKTKGAGTSKTT